MAFCLEVPAPVWVDDEEEAARLLEQAYNWPVVGIDTETTGLDIMKDRIYFWSLASETERYCLPWTMLEVFKEFIEDKDVEFANQNANFDAHMFANSGIAYANGQVVGNRNDPMVMHALVDDINPHGLDWIAKNVLKLEGGKLFSYRERFGKTPIQEIVPGHPLFEDMVDYASHDAWLHLKAFYALKDRLEQEDSYFGTLWNYYRELECPLHDVIFAMERRGILIDVGYLRPKAKQAREIMETTLEKLTEVTGKYVNPGSTKQLRELFYDTLGMRVKKRTSGGQGGEQKGSTDVSVLQSWSERDDLAGKCARLVLQYRKHQKIKGTYIDGILERTSDRTGRVHCRLTQHVARTGRLSSRDPNLQNLIRPENDPYGIRRAFVPEIGETAEDDWLMLVADYSQLEMMLAASNCGDTNMLRAIHEGRDLHCNTASLMFRVPYEDVVSAKRKKDAGKPLTPDEKSFHMMRQQAKTIGFGVLYGEGPKKLSVQLDIDFVEARRLQNMFFSAFPTLRRHINNINEACEKSNTAQTLLGRRRRLPNASNPWDKGQRFEALRQAFNFTIQGFAAEIAKQAMLDCARDDRLRDLDCHLLMQVHDELLFECPPDAVDEATELIQQHMEGVFPELLKVDLSAEVGQGPNWQEAK